MERGHIMWHIRPFARNTEPKLRSFIPASFLLLAIGILSARALGQRQDQNVERPMAGPRATVIQETSLYVSPDRGSTRMERVPEGREMVVAERNGPWVRVFANTDAPDENKNDAPTLGDDAHPIPVTGWMEAKAVLEETTPNGDLILMGEAATMESLASDARGPRNAGQAARLLYQRLIEFYPGSPLAAEAAWRAADIRWQFDKADLARLPSAKEKEAWLRQHMDESELRKVIKLWPRSRQADLAAYDLIDNKICGDWQGDPRCPEKEAQIYEDYATRHPTGPRTAQALYQAAWRMAVLHDIYAADGNDKKTRDALNEARNLAQFMEKTFPASDYSARAATLVYKIRNSITVYGYGEN